MVLLRYGNDAGSMGQTRHPTLRSFAHPVPAAPTPRTSGGHTLVGA